MIIFSRKAVKNCIGFIGFIKLKIPLIIYFKQINEILAH